MRVETRNEEADWRCGEESSLVLTGPRLEVGEGESSEWMGCSAASSEEREKSVEVSDNALEVGEIESLERLSCSGALSGLWERSVEVIYPTLEDSPGWSSWGPGCSSTFTERRTRRVSTVGP